ncbi:MAG: hydrogenase [Rhodocyclales bacterium RIFCSPLOWO2_02_FULL_63_24]|nr:MAG: hydrogenase [Rhodocyclales bacterium GWA2_65_19]OHC70384.1 MAG: hydrogenase [Rhodocyclales bacterium RIFCSPLOWO2_02_FULL_63_24]
MPLSALNCQFHALPGPLPMQRATVTREQWQMAPAAVDQVGGRLVSLWGSDRRGIDGGFAVSAAYALAEGLAWLSLPIPVPLPDAAGAGQASYPDIARVFPAAGRMQRACRDLLGLVAEDATDQRPWLRHGAWPEDYFPLRRENSGAESFALTPESYPFVLVEGDGVHEIAVGPVHAGIIEPGHFRFSVIGERVLRLEQHLGYKHKGIEKRFEHIAPLDGYRLAGRVSGDSTVAFAWAYCMALESIAGCEISWRARWLRALLLERERVANHLGDLGALGNDAALGFGLAQFSRLKEDWLRLNRELFGHRFMMDRVVPGGVDVDLDANAGERIRRQCDEIEADVRTLKGIYDEHSGLQDRFLTTGRVSPKLAAQLGLCGMAGRASAQASDLRMDFAWEPYAALQATMVSHRNGDVAARVTVRFEEILESLRLIRETVRRLPQGTLRIALNPLPAEGVGAGWVEGWRGDVLVTLELEAGGIRRCHCHDPSWQNWPLLEHAVMDNIVPDFPLINKSFNLSYSGQDL